MNKRVLTIAIGSVLAFVACGKQNNTTTTPTNAMTQDQLQMILQDYVKTSTLAGDLQTLNDIITNLQEQLITLQNDENTDRGHIAILQTSLENLTVKVNVNTTNIAANSSNITNILNILNGTGSEGPGVLVNIATLQSEYAAQQGQINTINGQMTSIQNDIATINGQIVALQTNEATHAAAIATLQNQVTTLQGQMSTLQSQVDVLTARIYEDISRLQLQLTTLTNSTNDALAEMNQKLETLIAQVAVLDDKVALLLAENPTNLGFAARALRANFLAGTNSFYIPVTISSPSSSTTWFLSKLQIDQQNVDGSGSLLMSCSAIGTECSAITNKFSNSVASWFPSNLNSPEGGFIDYVLVRKGEWDVMENGPLPTNPDGTNAEYELRDVDWLSSKKLLDIRVGFVPLYKNQTAYPNLYEALKGLDTSLTAALWQAPTFTLKKGPITVLATCIDYTGDYNTTANPNRCYTIFGETSKALLGASSAACVYNGTSSGGSVSYCSNLSAQNSCESTSGGRNSNYNKGCRWVPATVAGNGSATP